MREDFAVEHDNNPEHKQLRIMFPKAGKLLHTSDAVHKVAA